MDTVPLTVAVVIISVVNFCINLHIHPCTLDCTLMMCHRIIIAFAATRSTELDSKLVAKMLVLTVCDGNNKNSRRQPTSEAMSFWP